jgi:hypothetical protein
LAKRPTVTDANPEDFPQTTPRDLYPIGDIRLVMRDIGALTERIDGLIKSVEKIGPASEKALDKQTAEVKEKLADLKADLKETDSKVVDIEKKVSFVKGAMWVLGLLLVAVGAVATLAVKLIG